MQKVNRLKPFFENLVFEREDNHMIVNFGPQHPSSHGQLRLILELDGEKVSKATPDIGYLHRGMEKMAENMIYNEFLPTTDRMDYIAASANNYGFALAVEKLLDVEVPRRAKVIRMSGKVGPVVGATWRGKDVMRSLPKKTNRLATAFQQQQRSKFSMTTEFLSGVQPVIKRYFGSDTGLKTRRNQAMSYLMKEAIVFNDPNYEWDYTKILISKGDLLGINNGAVTAGTGQNLDFTWTDNSGQGEAAATDQLVVVVYEPTSKATVHSLNAGDRSGESAPLSLPNFLSGLEVQVWSTFVSTDDKLFATSLYLGAVTVS